MVDLTVNGKKVSIVRKLPVDPELLKSNSDPRRS
jgi:hypothetical protein